MALVAVLSSCLGVHQSFSQLHTRITLEFLATIDYTDYTYSANLWVEHEYV